jgi:hypothetical protein
VSTYVPAALRRQIRARFADHCAYCQTAEALTVATFEIDHIIPRVAAGETEFDNLCLACPSCNRYKSDRQTGVSSELGQSVALFHPQREPWSEHFTWSSDSSEIIALTPTGQATVEALRMNRLQLVRLCRLWARMGEHPPRLE